MFCGVVTANFLVNPQKVFRRPETYLQGPYFVLWAPQVLEENATLYYGTLEKVLHEILFEACCRGSQVPEEPAIQSTDPVNMSPAP